jgi:hypothetical protein
MIMRKEKKKRLKAKGWKIGNAKDFLGLTEEESAYIELKIRLAEAPDRVDLSRVGDSALLVDWRSRLY